MKNLSVKYYSNDNGYIMYNSVLTEVSIKSIDYDVKKNVIKYQVALSDGKLISITGDNMIYSSQEGFEAGNNNGYSYKEVENLIRALSYHVKRDENNLVVEVEPYIFQFIDGEPKEVAVDVTHITWTSESKNWECTDKDGILLQEWYKNREKAIKWNDYKVVNADGTEIVHKSSLRRMMLTEEQKKAVSEIHKAIEKARKLGVHFCYDSEWDEILAVNSNDFEKMYSTWDEPEEDETEIEELDMRLAFGSKIKFYDTWINCDSLLTTKLKEQ